LDEKIVFDNEITLDFTTVYGVEMGSMREVYVEELLKLANEGDEIVLVLSDNGTAKAIAKFREVYPERVIDVGVAEPNQVGIAAGLGLSGKQVYAQFFGTFLALRCLDQVHTDIAYNDVPVRMIDTHSGLTSAGGATHYNLMDIAVMRNLPNMTVVGPSDPNQCAKVIRASISHPNPMFIRIGRATEPVVYTGDYDFQIGKAVEACPGDDITVIGTGIGVAFAVSAANGLAKEGISVRVLDMHTIRPLDKDAILRGAKETGGIITVEDHFIVGGLGSAVAEVLADAGVGIPFCRLGVPDDDFPTSAEPYELYKHLGFDPEGIKCAVKKMWNKIKE
jgi:transketolase